MTPRHKDLIIDTENPFLNCKLEREQYAKILTEMIQNHSEGFVLAIDNEWGTGKTTFVRMWEQQLKNQDFKTLYFNAWENDFEQDVLVAMISELKELKEPKHEELYKNVIKKAAPITKKLALRAATTLIDKYVGKDFTKEVFNNITEATIEGLESELKSYTDRKQSVANFKKSLSLFVEKVIDDKSVIFIIDELDRCRPTYAVEVLEQIKHLFSVPGIIFVLSIDKEQLGNAIRGVYGSDRINADEYLRRFIDIEYSIPEPNTKTFCTYLFEYFDFKKYFNNRRNSNDDYTTFIDFSSILFKSCDLTLRVQEKIYAHARVVISSFGPSYLMPSVFIFLIFLKNAYSNLYQKIRNLELTHQELINEVEGIILGKISEESIHQFIYMEALLLVMYDNAHLRRNYNSRIDLFKRNSDTNEQKFIINSQLYAEHSSLEGMVKHIRSSSDYYSISIEHLIKKIDLIERLKY